MNVEEAVAFLEALSDDENLTSTSADIKLFIEPPSNSKAAESEEDSGDEDTATLNNLCRNQLLASGSVEVSLCTNQ